MWSVVFKVSLKGNGHPRARLTPDLTPPPNPPPPSPTTPPGVESITSTARCVGKSAVRVATPWNIPGGDKPVRGYCPPDGCWISSLSIQRRSYNNGGQQNLLSCQQRWRRAAGPLLKLPVQHSGKKFHLHLEFFFTSQISDPNLGQTLARRIPYLVDKCLTRSELREAPFHSWQINQMNPPKKVKIRKTYFWIPFSCSSLGRTTADWWRIGLDFFSTWPNPKKFLFGVNCFFLIHHHPCWTFQSLQRYTVLFNIF